MGNARVQCRLCVWECIKDCTTMRAPEEINPPLPVLARDLDVIRICGFL